MDLELEKSYYEAGDFIWGHIACFMKRKIIAFYCNTLHLCGIALSAKNMQRISNSSRLNNIR